MGFGYSFAVGIALGSAVFVGGRYAHSRQLLDPFEPGPPEIFRDVGPLAGLLWQGQYGHLALGSGVVVVRGRRHGEVIEEIRDLLGEAKRYEMRPRRTVGAPIDVQAFVMLAPHVGFGVHGYATVTPDENLRGLSVQFMVRPR